MKEIFYEWGGLNLLIFNTLNGLHLGWLDACALALSTLGTPHLAWAYPLLFAMWAYWRNRQSHNTRHTPAGLKRLKTAGFFALCLLLETSLVLGAKLLFDMPRPADRLGGALHVVGITERLHSFPSGHAALAGLLAAFFWPNSTRSARFLLASLVPLMMVSRVVVGAHFPVDVCAGALIGLSAPRMTRFLTAMALDGLYAAIRPHCRSENLGS